MLLASIARGQVALPAAPIKDNSAMQYESLYQCDPLFNSLPPCVSISRIDEFEIMTMDDVLERLGKLVPTLNPQSFVKHAAYRFNVWTLAYVGVSTEGIASSRLTYSMLSAVS
jgi:hypothetical protein